MKTSSNTTIEGCIALVTGANRGIGRAFVEQLCQRNAGRVYATARSLNSLPAAWRGRREIIPLQLDITCSSDIAQVVENANDVDLLINNAGVVSSGSLLRSGYEALRPTMEVNFFGTLDMTRAFAKVMSARNRGGAIVNMLTVMALSSAPLTNGYCASKAAAYAMTQGLRSDLKAKGISIHAVLAGLIDTDMARNVRLRKERPDIFAATVLKEIEKGTEEIIADAHARAIYSAWRKDPRALARAIAQTPYLASKTSKGTAR